MTSKSIVCPFCPLHCDDVVVRDGELEGGCRRGRRAAEQANSPPPPRIGSREATVEAVVDLVRERCCQDRPVPLIAEMLDLGTARVVEALRRAGHVAPLLDSPPARVALRTATSRDGLIAATFGDVRRHADLLWTIGRPEREWPRLLERVVDPERPPRHIAWPDGGDANLLAELSRVGEIAEATSRDAASLRRKTTVASVQELIEAVSASRYVAVFVGEDAWDDREAEAAAVMLQRIVRRWNDHIRAVLVLCDPGMTSRSVMAWSSNLAAEVLPSDVPADAGLVRLGTPPTGDPPKTMLQIGGCDPGPDVSEAYLPAATVGLHEAGAVIRGDGSVTLPLVSCCESPWPTVAAILRSLFSL